MNETAADHGSTAVPITLHDWLKHIQTRWELSDDKMAALAHVTVEQYLEWFKEGRGSSPATIPPGMDSAVPIVSIYKSLAAQYPDVDDQVKWLFTVHQDFGNQKPIDIAASTLENLSWVSYYLQSKLSET
ncbi:MAG: hypothetical protein H7222_05415 [Methylotenera sp.]|nr:hypothetical protein [Oligoflexia bacterium]